MEFRIDVLVEHAEGVAAARRLVQESPLPVLLTCRSDAEGDRGGKKTDRVSFLEAWTAEVWPLSFWISKRPHGRALQYPQKVRLVVNHPQQVRRTARIGAEQT